MKSLVLLVSFALPLTFAARAEDPAPAAPAATAAPAAQTVRNVTPDEASKLLQEKKDVVVLDVRTPEEYAEGHIAGAKNIDFMGADFAKKVAALDPSKSYLVHCAAGGRSSRAVKIMQQQHFADIYHLPDGFSGWKEAGKPIEK